MKMQKELVRDIAIPCHDLQDMIWEEVADVPVFRFVSKLSSGGVVVRVLQAPETELPFWGQRKEGRIQMVQNLPSINISPYQPIVSLSFQEQQDHTQVRILMEPHKEATMFAVAEWIGAALCVVAGLVAVQQNPLAQLAIYLGLAMAIIPRFRAKWSFQRESKRCEEAVNQFFYGLEKRCNK